MKEFKKEFRPLKGYVIFAYVLSVVNSLALISISLLTQNFVDKAVAGKLSIAFAAIMFAVIIAYAAFSYFINVFLNRTTLRAVKLIRVSLFGKIIRSPAVVQPLQSADLLSRCIDESATLAEDVVFRNVIIFNAVFELVAFFAVIIYTSYIVGFIALAFVPPLFLFSLYVAERYSKIALSAANRLGKLKHTFMQGARGVHQLKIFGGAAFYEKKFRRDHNALSRHSHKQVWVGNLDTVFIKAVSSYVLPIVMAVSAAVIVSSGRLNVGAIVLIYFLGQNLSTPITNLGAQVKNIKTSGRRYKRIDPLFNAPEDKGGEAVFDDFKRISVKIKDFGYEEDEAMFEDLGFTIKNGDRIAILGQSGSGKSTIFGILTKQIELSGEQGAVFIDGVNLNDISNKCLFSKLTLVTQNSFLFEGSVKDNLCLGEKYSDDEIAAALYVCALDNFIADYGLNYVIAEDSDNLSAGEIQRLCLARALLRKPRLLLLDEPASALDSKISAVLAERLAKYLDENGTTLILTSNRPEALALANRKVRMR